MDLHAAICTVVGHNQEKVWQRCKRCGYKKDTSVIPKGEYCYTGGRIDSTDGHRKRYGICPYWSRRDDKPEQANGYCSYLEQGDWEENGTQLLWDQVKECGVIDYEI